MRSKTNETVLKEIGEQRKLLETVQKRKTKIFGHTLQHNNYARNMFDNGREYLEEIW